MNLDPYLLFLEVAQSGSFSKVATHRHTVQSHVSRKIQQLENELGAKLFVRTGRGVVLSEFAELILPKVRMWLSDTEHLLRELHARAEEPVGTVRLGILPSAAFPLITHAYQLLQGHYPAIRLQVREGQGEDLDALLDNGLLDLAVLYRFRKPANTSDRYLSNSDTYLVGKPGDPQLRVPSINFAALKGLPLILPSRPSRWRALLDDTAKSKGFELRTTIEADSLTLQKRLAQEGQLYAVLGSYAIRRETEQGLLAATRIGRPDLRRYVTLAQPKNGKPTPATRIVVKVIEQLTLQWGGNIAIKSDAAAG